MIITTASMSMFLFAIAHSLTFCMVVGAVGCSFAGLSTIVGDPDPAPGAVATLAAGAVKVGVDSVCDSCGFEAKF